MRERPVIDPQPEWDIRFQGFAAKFINQHKWKLDPTLDFDDLMQDAYLIFRRVLCSYPWVTDASNIMALFKIAMKNEFIDGAKQWTKKRRAEISIETILSVTDSDDYKLLDTLGEENNEGLLRVIINEWPPEMRAALAVLTSDEKMAILRQPQVQTELAKMAGIEPEKETLNEAICRIIRLPKTVDLLGMLRSALTSKCEE